MKTIWKFPLREVDLQTIQIPEDSEILTVQTQRGVPCLWVLCDDEKPLMRKNIAMYGTGQSISASVEDYIGSYQILDERVIFHIFTSL